MPPAKHSKPARRSGPTHRSAGIAGDWKPAVESTQKPSAHYSSETIPHPDDVYTELESKAPSGLDQAVLDIAAGRAEVVESVLFCARFNAAGMMVHSVKESEKGLPPYRLLKTQGNKEYREALKYGEKRWKKLADRLKESGTVLSRLKSMGTKAAREAIPFLSNSDAGSIQQVDPNQYTEYTPYYNGPFNKQQYADFFRQEAKAFQAYNHNPVAKRIVDILIQYAFGRGIQIKNKDKKKNKDWNVYQRKNKIITKIRKYWFKEALIAGENYIDKARLISIDPSTIYDIICEGWGEYVDKPLYYQQMFQTATTMYTGIQVTSVPGSKDTKLGKYIIRQIPADQVIQLKLNVNSIEKRGRSIYYPIFGFLKLLVDTYNGQARGEQLRASFVFDDTIDGSDADVSAHAKKYSYMPAGPSVFAHNTCVKRVPLAPMSGVSGSGANICQEILAVIATSQGIPKEHLNVTLQGGGSRATAVVGSEPFTKVIENLQEEGSDLLHLLIEDYCKQNSLDYDPEEWIVSFPSVVKDALNDRLKALATTESMGWFSSERVATMAAGEMDVDDYDYDIEMKDHDKIKDKKMDAALNMPGHTPPAVIPREKPTAPAQPPAPEDNNPVHGAGKQKVIKQHKKL